MSTEPTIPNSSGSSTLALASTAVGTKPCEITLEAILTQEFAYAANCATQVVDRQPHTVNQFLLLAGGLAGWLISTLIGLKQVGLLEYWLPIAVVTVIVGSILSWIYARFVMREHAAQRDSPLAMYSIKEFYIYRLRPFCPDAERAFRWRLHTLPTDVKVGSITFMRYTIISLFGSLFVSASFLSSARYLQYQGWLPALVTIPDAVIYSLTLASGIISLASFYGLGYAIPARLATDLLKHEVEFVRRTTER